MPHRLENTTVMSSKSQAKIQLMQLYAFNTRTTYGRQGDAGLGKLKNARAVPAFLDFTLSHHSFIREAKPHVFLS